MKPTILLSIFSIVLVTACGNDTEFIVPANINCTITDGYIVCPDGTQYRLPNDGADGIDGVDGADGLDGTIFDIVDPCGDGPGHDEILMVFTDGTVIAWYKNLGLSVLDPMVIYVTTDSQKCKFRINNGFVEEL